LRGAIEIPILTDPEPDDVAAAAYAALTDANPKLRYLVVPNQGQARVAIGSLLRRVAQLNQGQPYSLSRDSLVAMLDQALAQAGGRR
jgi:hypothetical protein